MSVDFRYDRPYPHRDAWEACLVHAGPQPLTPHLLRYVDLPAGDLPEVTVDLRFAGGNGRRHVPSGCQVKLGAHVVVPDVDVNVETVTVADLMALQLSRQHDCMAQVLDFVPAGARLELGLLHDAWLLLLPWWDAVALEAQTRRPALPKDDVPLTSGLLPGVAADLAAYAAAHPDRGHMAAAYAQVTGAVGAWQARVRDWPSLVAADPHQVIVLWQQQLGLADLDGSERQVRWAQTLRREFFDAHADGFLTVARRETSASVWIGLRDTDPQLLLDEWLSMRDRALDRARGEASLVRGRW